MKKNYQLAQNGICVITIFNVAAYVNVNVPLLLYIALTHLPNQIDNNFLILLLLLL